MKITIHVLIFYLLISFSSSSLAIRFDGKQAYKMCSSTKANQLSGCAMFILGAAETLRFAGLNDVHYCLTNNITNQDLKIEFVRYLKENESKQHYSAISLFYAALVESYHCINAQGEVIQ